MVQDSMLSLTAHCSCLDFSRKSFVLQSREFNDSHTVENTVNFIASCLQSWKIENKLVYIVRDKGSNFVTGLQDADLPNYIMFSTHICMLSQPCFGNLLAAGRRLVGHFKRSNANTHVLSRIQEQLSLNKHRLIQAEPTKWNTSYYMLECLIEQKQAICAAEIECKVNSELTNHQWQLAEKVVKVLKPFEEEKVQISSEGSSAALVIPVVNS